METAQRMQRALRTGPALKPIDGETFWPKSRMTRWFDPLAMFRLLLRIWATRRMTHQRNQGNAQPPAVLDYAQCDDDFWFDYVADMGDAFDPTMCVAWHLGRDGLQRSEIDPALHVDPEFGLPDLFPGMLEEDIPALLPRGQLLVMGGDQVYPNGTTARYRDQVVGPYNIAWERPLEGSTPDDSHGGGTDESGLLAIPANHDWYGGIGPFQDAFCARRKIGGWRTAQDCSWWSARLAHGWWIWGIDTALDGTINHDQFEYFRSARDQMGPDARLIACTPVPLWRLRERHVDHLDNLARFFFGLGVAPEVYLSGDYHIAALHRRERTDGVPEWHLTDGGGGAFQHPVHNLDRLIPNSYGGLPDTTVDDGGPFHLIGSWPTNNESREGTGGWWHLLFDRAAVPLIATLAAIQLPIMALAGSDHRGEAENLRSAMQTATDDLVPAGGIASAAVILLATFGLAKATSSARGATWWARSVGFGHGLMQAMVFLAARVLGNLSVRGTTGSVEGFASTVVTWLTLGGAAIVGGVASIVVLGSYLRFANRQFRMHDNESYSARHSGDNRHFSRFRISPDGTLSCFVVAFRRTGTGWVQSLQTDQAGPPSDSSPPELIDLRFRTTANER